MQISRLQPESFTHASKACAAGTNDKPRCPKCNSPDLVPYKFGDIHDDVAAEYRARFPRARLCLDCLYCEWQPEEQ